MAAGHLSCRDCCLRLRTDSPTIAVLEHRCPICGAPLIAVASASEVVGFRSFDMSPLFERESDHQLDSAEFMSRREAARVRDAEAAGRWSDDGGSAAGEAVARWPAPQ
jgi:hypothetical protein